MSDLILKSAIDHEGIYPFSKASGIECKIQSFDRHAPDGHGLIRVALRLLTADGSNYHLLWRAGFLYKTGSGSESRKQDAKKRAEVLANDVKCLIFYLITQKNIGLLKIYGIDFSELTEPEVERRAAEIRKSGHINDVGRLKYLIL